MTAEQPPAAGTPATVDGTEHAVVALKHEEVVLVLRAPHASGDYLIYSLSENPTSDDARPYSLDVVRTSQLPWELSGLLLDRDALPLHLTDPSHVHVVVSTHSGLRRAPDFYEHVLRPLLGALGLDESKEGDDKSGYRVTVTQDSNTVRNVARELAADAHASEKTIVLLSGDGGVVDLLNGLDHAAAPAASRQSPPTIALLPLGTGNALFHSLHRPHYTNTNPDATTNPPPTPLILALRTLLLAGHPAPLPTFRASFSAGARLMAGDQAVEPVAHLLGAIVASYGFHASLVWESDTPAYRVHGDKRFGMAAGELLKLAHGYDARVGVRRGRTSPGELRGEEIGEGDGGELLAPRSSHLSSGATATGARWDGGGGEEQQPDSGGRFSYVLATLVSNLEKTFTISPASQPLDGRLRLVHFGDVGGDKTMEIMTAAYRDGAHVGMEEVGYEEVEDVVVTVAEEDPRWRKVCIDGSIVELQQGGSMTVRREEKQWLRVLVDNEHVV